MPSTRPPDEGTEAGVWSIGGQAPHELRKLALEPRYLPTHLLAHCAFT